ncbi:uncharacterized protein LOC127872920 [Dreissena polymorpha]|uniref:Uncharacterized protein n=1 Tax=Dreissena polymorpha TaxID=45954 RepID=A0A9D4LB50_DREPO|nr:uncharacterized protein LOC127872920 [Dreissena polymorpha]KAH3854554.1 hypothetical protein DPMN_097097 [Dreissena polymorpha]
MWWNLRLIALTCAVLIAVSNAQQCRVVPKCTCDIDGESVDVEEQHTGSELLAGTVGALGSVVVTGGGLGVWYMVRGRKDVTPSDMDDDSASSGEDNRGDQKERPPPYNNDSGQGEDNFRGGNVYRAGRHDPNMHRSGIRMESEF